MNSTARRGGVLAAIQRHRTLAVGATAAIGIGIVLGIATTRGGHDAVVVPDATIVVVEQAPPPHVIDARVDIAEATADAAPCDEDALLKTAEGSVALGNHAAALEQYETALSCRSSSHTLQLTFMEACNANNVTKARIHWKQLSPELQNRALQICVRNNITREMLDVSDGEAERITGECLALVAESKWSSLAKCADKLAALDSDAAKKFKTQAGGEVRAQIENDKMEVELGHGSLLKARNHLDAIPETSTYKRPAQTTFDAAEAKVIDEFKGRAAKFRSAGRCADLATLERQAIVTDPHVADALRPYACKNASPPPPPAPAVCDGDALMKKAESYVALGDHVHALKAYEDALRCKPDIHTVQLAFMEACNAESLAKAKAFWKRMSIELQNRTLQVCVRNHITKQQLDAP